MAHAIVSGLYALDGNMTDAGAHKAERNCRPAIVITSLRDWDR